jgi:hypothetical protein
VLESIPALNVSRSPDRFTMPLTLCLGVLAGYGTAAVARRASADAARPGRSAAVGLVALGLLALELFPGPYPQLSAETPRWYATLAAEGDNFSVLELPPQDLYWHGAFRMYFQTAHGRPVYGGYISREYPHPFLERTPGYKEMVRPEEAEDMISQDRAEWLSALARYGTRYVVLQKDRLPDVVEEIPDVSPSREAVVRVLGVEAPLYEDEQLAAYAVPEPERAVPFISLGDGWEPREVTSSGPQRWMGEQAVLRLDSPARVEAQLRFRATTVGPPRSLVIRHGDVIVFDEEVGPLREYTVGPLGLPEGASYLTITSPDGTVRPAEMGLGDDTRDLGFAFLGMRLLP